MVNRTYPQLFPQKLWTSGEPPHAAKKVLEPIIFSTSMRGARAGSVFNTSIQRYTLSNFNILTDIKDLAHTVDQIYHSLRGELNKNWIHSV